MEEIPLLLHSALAPPGGGERTTRGVGGEWGRGRGEIKYELKKRRISGRNRNVLGACEIQNTEQERNSASGQMTGGGLSRGEKGARFCAYLT